MKHVLFFVSVTVSIIGIGYAVYTMTRNVPTPMVILAAALAAAWTISDYRRSL